MADIIGSGTTAKTYHSEQSGEGVARTLTYRKLSAAPFHLVVGMGTEDYLAHWRSEVTNASIIFACFMSSP